MSFRVVAAQSALQSWQLSAHLQRNTEDLKAPSFSSANHGAAVIHKHFQNRGWTLFLFCVWKCVYETCLRFITRVAASSLTLCWEVLPVEQPDLFFLRQDGRSFTEKVSWEDEEEGEWLGAWWRHGVMIHRWIFGKKNTAWEISAALYL